MSNSRIFQIVTILNSLFLIGLLVYQFVLKDHKMAYVDSSKLVNNYGGMIDARKAYQQKASTWQANIDTLMNEVTLQVMKH